MRQKSYLVAFILFLNATSLLASSRVTGDPWRPTALQALAATAVGLWQNFGYVAGQVLNGVPQGACSSTDEFGDGCTAQVLGSGQCATYGNGTFVPGASGIAMYLPNGTQVSLAAGRAYDLLGTTVQWCLNDQGDRTLRVGTADSFSDPVWKFVVWVVPAVVVGAVVGAWGASKIGNRCARQEKAPFESDANVTTAALFQIPGGVDRGVLRNEGYAAPASEAVYGRRPDERDGTGQGTMPGLRGARRVGSTAGAPLPVLFQNPGGGGDRGPALRNGGYEQRGGAPEPLYDVLQDESDGTGQGNMPGLGNTPTVGSTEVPDAKRSAVVSESEV